MQLPNDTVSLGIDEAGRGPVIGPLVISGVIATDEMIKQYEDLGITDSKLIKEAKRYELANFIKKNAVKVVTIPLLPTEIDNAVLNEKDNLNLLELRTMAKIIKENLVHEVLIDAISTPRYATSELKKLLIDEFSAFDRVSEDKLNYKRIIGEKTYLTSILAQNKADLTYKVVSAASLVAKTTRDTMIRTIENEFGLKEGLLASGYPNNQLKDFLVEYNKEIHQRKFNFIRYSWNWKPLQDILQKKKPQKKLNL